MSQEQQNESRAAEYAPDEGITRDMLLQFTRETISQRDAQLQERRRLHRAAPSMDFISAVNDMLKEVTSEDILCTVLSTKDEQPQPLTYDLVLGLQIDGGEGFLQIHMPFPDLLNQLPSSFTLFTKNSDGLTEYHVYDLIQPPLRSFRQDEGEIDWAKDPEQFLRETVAKPVKPLETKHSANLLRHATPDISILSRIKQLPGLHTSSAMQTYTV